MYALHDFHDGISAKSEVDPVLGTTGSSGVFAVPWW